MAHHGSQQPSPMVLISGRAVSLTSDETLISPSPPRSHHWMQRLARMHHLSQEWSSCRSQQLTTHVDVNGSCCKLINVGGLVGHGYVKTELSFKFYNWSFIYRTHAHTVTHTHIRFMDFVRDYPGELVPEPISILLKQETMSSRSSTEPYTNLHITSDRYPRRHPTTQYFTGWMPFLLLNQQRQSTEGFIY